MLFGTMTNLLEAGEADYVLPGSLDLLNGLGYGNSLAIKNTFQALQ